MSLNSIKRRRQQSILGLVGQEPLATQAALVRRLAAEGFEVNQSTVSRDIKELGLVKAPRSDGGYGYTRPVNVAAHDERHLRVLQEFTNEVNGSGAMVVIKTDPGNAQPVAEAIDRLKLDLVVGTVAGDNTLFVVLREGARWNDFAERLEQQLS